MLQKMKKISLFIQGTIPSCCDASFWKARLHTLPRLHPQLSQLGTPFLEPLKI
jgi:hypothetical protein